MARELGLSYRHASAVFLALEALRSERHPLLDYGQPGRANDAAARLAWV
jgi:hypothetical protein